MQIKLAEALLRRKELQAKVEVLKRFKESELVYQVRGKRIAVSEGFEDLNADFPKLDANQVTAEFDFYARALRLIDARIQQVNWTAEIEADDQIMGDFVKHKD